MWWSKAAGRLERAKALDPAANAVNRVVDTVLPPGPVKDVLHGTWLGHSLHPLMVALPIGLWSSASLLDLTTSDRGGRRAAQRVVGAGVLLAVPTAAAGWADWSAIGDFRRPKRVGLVHGLSNGLTVAVYAASWLARRRGDHARGRDLALLGAGGLAVGGYLGGHLAYSNGVGVNRNADEQKKPRAWTDAAAAAEVPEGALVRVEVAGNAVLLTRRAGQLSAIGATCSHYGGPLEQGQVEGEDVVCPWHGSRFALCDGSVRRGPATVPQLAYDVRTVGDRLELRVRP